MASAGQTDSPLIENTERDATDQELVTAAVGGDQEALETLIRRHQHWIYNIAFRMVMVPEDAEDVTQDILMPSSEPSLLFRKGHDPLSSGSS